MMSPMGAKFEEFPVACERDVKQTEEGMIKVMWYDYPFHTDLRSSRRRPVHLPP